MRNSIIAFTVGLLWIAPAFAESNAVRNFDWEPWRSLPVQDGGRQKPLDTLAREFLRTTDNRAGVKDPETGQKLDAIAFYLTMLFDWQGWDQPLAPHPPIEMDFSAAYFRSHKADKWDRDALILVNSSALRKALGMAEGRKYISPFDLSRAEIRDSQSKASTPFPVWAAKLARAKQENLSELEKNGLELAGRLWSYQEHRMGRRLEILPLSESPHKDWVSLSTVLQSNFDGKTDPNGRLRKVKDCFQRARAAYRGQNAPAFKEASSAFLAAVREAGPELGAYPLPKTIDLEVAYNQVAPFRLAWVLSLLALIGALANRGLKWKALYVAACLIFAAGIAAMFVGFAMRCTIAGRPPITNMYESVLSVGVGIAIMGLIYELIYRKQYVLIAASALSAFVLILADSSPTLFDPSIRPLPPVLRSKFWLWVHVVPIMASYAAFAVAWILANASLGCYLGGRAGKEIVDALHKLTLKILRIGVFLLTVGTILGGLWADYSWGRFWGWDPKEVWALISLLFYLNILHARYVGWIADFGTAVWSVISFVVVIMTWYGVNFVLGTGLHSYGFGGGGERIYVAGTLVVQFLYLAAAIAKRANAESASAG